MEPRIVVVDNDRDQVKLIRERLAAGGFKTVDVLTDPPHVALSAASRPPYDVALIKAGMPNRSDQQVLAAIRNSSPGTECLMLTAFDDINLAAQCLCAGAYDYLLQPVAEEDLISAVQRALERKCLLDILNLQKSPHSMALAYPAPFQQIVTFSKPFLRVLKEAELLAGGNGPILITGEKGTGKKLLAKAIHDASSRYGKPFLSVNMESFSADQLEADLFGCAQGSYPETQIERQGYLARANHGTLFLRHIGSLSLDMQGKLLRALQEGEFTPQRESIRQETDVRVIAAANEDADQMIRTGRLRKDLFYRIRAAWLHLPPLRERVGDIRLLIDHFLKESCKSSVEYHLEEPALDALLSYQFPGNVSELRSLIQSAVKLARGRSISVECLPENVRGQNMAVMAQRSNAHGSVLPLLEVERQHILSVYQQMHGNKVRTARALGIGLNTLRRKLKAYDVK
jgi:DNA-binding NtrC family response regulator